MIAQLRWWKLTLAWLIAVFAALAAGGYINCSDAQFPATVKAEWRHANVLEWKFDRGEAQCPSCKRPIGPADKPAFVHSIGNGEPRLATMRCGRCQAMLTVRFEQPGADSKP